MTNQAGTSEGSSAGTSTMTIAHHASRRAIAVAWSLRAAIVATAIFHVIEGEILYVILCLGALALLVTPPLLARSSRANLPIELEIIMLWWFVGDMTLGRAAKLYETSLWFDKVLHLGNSILLAFVAFLVIYLLQMTCCLSGPPWTRGVLIVVVTLGIGAGWEILEYLADASFGLGAQGSPLMAPLDDTMWDLMLDGLGGLIGGLLGPIYMRSGRSHNRVRTFRQLAGMHCNHEDAVKSCRYCGDGATASTASGLTGQTGTKGA